MYACYRMRTLLHASKTQAFTTFEPQSIQICIFGWPTPAEALKMLFEPETETRHTICANARTQ
jgi:hypothetical protein